MNLREALRHLSGLRFAAIDELLERLVPELAVQASVSPSRMHEIFASESKAASAAGATAAPKTGVLSAATDLITRHVVEVIAASGSEVSKTSIAEIVRDGFTLGGRDSVQSGPPKDWTREEDKADAYEEPENER